MTAGQGKWSFTGNKRTNDIEQSHGSRAAPRPNHLLGQFGAEAKRSKPPTYIAVWCILRGGSHLPTPDMASEGRDFGKACQFP